MIKAGFHPFGVSKHFSAMKRVLNIFKCQVYMVGREEHQSSKKNFFYLSFAYKCWRARVSVSNSLLYYRSRNHIC